MKNENKDENLSRREIRRKRRIKNQILAYVSLTAFAILMIIGVFFGGKAVGNLIAEKGETLPEETVVSGSEVEETEMIKETEEIVVEDTEEDFLGELADAYIAEMTIEEKVAGLFIVTPEAITGVDTVIQAGNGTKEALEEYPVGGLIYFDKNIKSETQLKEMIENTIGFSENPLFIAVDEEGGDVARLGNSDLGIEKMPTMEEIGTKEPIDEGLAGMAGTSIGTYLTEYGFNVNFAPVGDVLSNPDSPLGSRSFSGDPAIASGMVSSFVQALQATGVSSCVKHFPGIGNADIDTHDGIATIDVAAEVLREREFLPFIAGIEAGTDFIMVGHVIANALDEELPSSLSDKVITDVLRTELGYEGIVVTDALNMKAITDQYESEEIAIMAIQAGVDILLMPEDFEKAYKALLEAIAEGSITEERINDSLKRIYKVKLKGELE